MSLVSGLSLDEDGYMWSHCPACGEEVEIEEDDFNAILDDGNNEYFLYCPDCGQGFYASKYYN